MYKHELWGKKLSVENNEKTAIHFMCEIKCQVSKNHTQFHMNQRMWSSCDSSVQASDQLSHLPWSSWNWPGCSKPSSLRVQSSSAKHHRLVQSRSNHLAMNWPIPHAQCFWNTLWSHHNPDQDKEVSGKEWDRSAYYVRYSREVSIYCAMDWFWEMTYLFLTCRNYMNYQCFMLTSWPQRDTVCLQEQCILYW